MPILRFECGIGLNWVDHPPDFKQSYNIKKKSEKDAHYELTGSSNKLLTTNVKLMVKAMKKIDVFFNDSDDVQHVLSHSVLQQNQGLLNLREIGEKAEDEFIEKRILGTESVWATMKKLKLYMFRDSLKSMKIKVGKRFLL